VHDNVGILGQSLDLVEQSRGDAILSLPASPPTAHLEHVSADRFAPEVMVEADDAMHLGARQVERIGQRRKAASGT
jgi:hypothetical protein